MRGLSRTKFGIVIVLILVGAFAVYYAFSVPEEKIDIIGPRPSINQRVAIEAPAVKEWKAGSSGSYVIGIINDDAEKSKDFYMFINLEQKRSGIPSDQLKTETKKWFSHDNGLSIRPSESKQTTLFVNIPSNAEPDIYLFRLFVCEETPNCNFTSGNFYDSEIFALEITS